ncbi:unnamed protein product [Phaedon cochleariae]|uniref:Aspartate aminotransferase, mitochondrial n=1 Tax=Phaedon cochleariae TaxID=80249 RepID=A0A9P0DYG9_PHACE|nr:unnamed protein product [Phaedon cochleariae]
MLVPFQNTLSALLKSQNLIFPAQDRRKSWWSDIPMAPPDSIFGLVEAYKKDPSPNKVNLVVGAYRDDNSQPYILPCVVKAEQKIHAKKPNKEYGPIPGSPQFCKAAVEFALGKDNELIKNGLNATVQTLSGTGALSLFGTFAKGFFPGEKIIYMPQPTWGNHGSIFKLAGFATKEYKYFDSKTHLLDYDGLLLSLCELPDRSMVLFHGCAHNPTGVDPGKEQWKEISQLAKEKHFFPVFDLAYQGFATGDPDNDAFAVRQFVKDGHRLVRMW